MTDTAHPLSKSAMLLEALGSFHDSGFLGGLEEQVDKVGVATSTDVESWLIIICVVNSAVFSLLLHTRLGFELKCYQRFIIDIFTY